MIFLGQIYNSSLSLFPPSAESAFLSISPQFAQYESAELDAVREFRAEISSFPAARATWLKGGLPLGDVTAEISTSLQQLTETR